VAGPWGLRCAVVDERLPPARVDLGAALDAGPVADLLPDCLSHLGAGVVLWVVPGDVRFLEPDVGRQLAGGLAWLDGGGDEGEPPAGPVRLAALEVAAGQEPVGRAAAPRLDEPVHAAPGGGGDGVGLGLGVGELRGFSAVARVEVDEVQAVPHDHAHGPARLPAVDDGRIGNSLLPARRQVEPDLVARVWGRHEDRDTRSGELASDV